MNTVALALLLVAQNSSTHEQIGSRYRVWDSAYWRHDVVELASLLHPRFRLVTGSGKAIPRKDYVKRLWRSKVPDVYQTKLLRVKRGGIRAIAWTEELTKQRSNTHLHRYRDVWVLRSGHWLMAESKTLEER